MNPAVKAACIAVGAHLAMYAWWIWADALLSDDYFMFARAPTFGFQASELFRPLGAMAAEGLTSWLQSSSNAVYWAKSVSLAVSSAFVALLAATLSHATRSVGSSAGVALLVSTNPGMQINAIWLCTLPIWISYTVTAAIFFAVIVARNWSSRSQWGLTVALTVVMTVLVLTYQMVPFVLAGAIAAYIVLTQDDWRALIRTVFHAGVIAAVATSAYLLALWYVTSADLIESGRASGAIGGMSGRISKIQLQEGMFWLNLLVTAKQSAIVVSLIISCGAAIDVLRNGGGRAARWALALLATIAALAAPAALNDFQAARLYAPGAIGVAGMLVASMLAIFRELPGGARSLARTGVIAAALFLGIASQAAGVIGIGLNQHAELQHIRNQVVQIDTTSLVRVHLVPPPSGRPFWNQPIRDPAHDMYVVRLSSYHSWTREGLVRFALRRLDPNKRIEVTVGDKVPEPAPGLVVVDMRPADRALFEIPF